MEEEMALLKSAKQDLKWFSANYGKLISEHNNRFVAIKNRQIIASDSSFERVLGKVKESNLDPAQLIIRYLTKTRTVLRIH